jgi:hypothetical protein
MAINTKEKNCFGCRFYNLRTNYCKLYDNPAVKVDNPEDKTCICFEERE